MTRTALAVTFVLAVQRLAAARRRRAAAQGSRYAVIVQGASGEEQYATLASRLGRTRSQPYSAIGSSSTRST